jgi:hypothetical protein
MDRTAAGGRLVKVSSTALLYAQRILQVASELFDFHNARPATTEATSFADVRCVLLIGRKNRFVQQKTIRR